MPGCPDTALPLAPRSLAGYGPCLAANLTLQKAKVRKAIVCVFNCMWTL